MTWLTSSSGTGSLLLLFVDGCKRLKSDATGNDLTRLWPGHESLASSHADAVLNRRSWLSAMGDAEFEALQTRAPGEMGTKWINRVIWLIHVSSRRPRSAEDRGEVGGDD